MHIDQCSNLLRNNTKETLWPLFASSYDLPQQQVSAEGKIFRGAMTVQGDGQAQANILRACSNNQYSPKIKVHKKSLVKSTLNTLHRTVFFRLKQLQV